MNGNVTQLHAGPLSVDFDNGDLRGVRLGTTELIRRIYMVFQDRNWTSRPWVIDDVAITKSDVSFTVRFTAQGTFDASNFTWDCIIEGTPEGLITYTVTGGTSVPFVRNRLGLCVLHPMELAGAQVEIEHSLGSRDTTIFPLEISPYQPFTDISAMTHPISDTLRARLELTGEVFETEDHRNWGDASFKTYCTPISLPFPVTVQPDEKFQQSVSLSLLGPVHITSAPVEGAIIEVFPTASPLPRIGLQIGPLAISVRQTSLLQDLRLDHLRVDIDATAADSGIARLTDAAAQARAIGCSLHVAIFDADESALNQLSQYNREVDDVVSMWFIFHADEKVTSSSSINQARRALGPQAVIAGGTNMYFTELNRQPPDTSLIDVVNFSLNPQVHSFDERTIFSNASTAMVIAENAPRLAGNALISISPITLRPRFNPNATDPAADVSNDQFPASDDQRQPTWLAAAWTALSLGFISAPGTIASVTYFETVGPRGIIDAETDQPYPVYDFLAAIAGYTHMYPCASNQPQEIDALVLSRLEENLLVMINMTDRERDVSIAGMFTKAVTAQPHGLTIINLPGGRNVTDII